MSARWSAPSLRRARPWLLKPLFISPATLVCLGIAVLAIEALVGYFVFVHHEGVATVSIFVAMIVVAVVVIYQTVRWREVMARLQGQDQQAQLAAIVEGADDAIVSTDLDRIIVSWNPAAERLFGYRACEVIGSHLGVLLPEDAEADIDAARARVHAGEIVKSDDVARRTKDGRVLRVAITRSPVRDAEGRVIGVARLFRDITEQKRAAEVQERLAALVEYSNDAMITRTLDGIITSWNGGATRMFGYTAQQAIGKHVHSLNVPGDKRTILDTNEQLCRGEAVPPMRNERITRDGRRIEVIRSVSPLRDGSGEIVGASLVFQDISLLTQAEAALSESEELLRAAFDQAAVGMALRSADPENSRWLRVNPKFCDMLGYTEAELLAMTSLDVTPPEDRQTSIEYSRKALDGQLPAYSRPKQYIRKDGRSIWVNLSLAIVRAKDGTPLNVMSVMEDITERRGTEIQLARLTSFYAALVQTNEAITRTSDRKELFDRVCRIAVEKTGLLVAWIGLVDEDDGRVRPMSAAGPAAAYAEGIAARLDGASLEGQVPSTRAILENRPCIADEFRDTDFAERWKERAADYGIRSAAAFPLHQAGVPYGCLCLYASEPHFFDAALVRLLNEMCLDLSFALDNLHREAQRREAEARLRESEARYRELNTELEARIAARTRELAGANRELEAANEELNAFAYSVSHDLRGTLRRVQGFSDLVLQENQQRLDAESVRRLGRIRANAEHMGEVVDNLLDLSRLSRHRLVRTACDLGAMAHDIVATLRERQPDRRVSVNIETGLHAYGDAALLRLALGNLLGNAWKFTQHTAAPHIAVAQDANGDVPIFYVRDNGAGFDPRYSGKLFRAFERLHTDKEFEGTGIGLSIVHRVITKHGGRVWAQGRVGEGACFYMTLPTAAH